MKLDFLKKGVINTANFIPRFAFGDMNMHPAVLVINVIGRLLAVYLCFQFNTELDIKSLILAILFPTLYIMYSIAVHGVDRILDLFGMERNTFEDIFEDSPDKCEERKGPDGDYPSIPGDKAACESVIMGQTDSRVKCESIKSTDTTIQGQRRNYHGVCKYTGDGSTEYRSCSDLYNQSICDTSRLNCAWRSFPGGETVYNRCKKLWDTNGNTSRGISPEKCPIGCPYYLNEDGGTNISSIEGTTDIECAQQTDSGISIRTSGGASLTVNDIDVTGDFPKQGTNFNVIRIKVSSATISNPKNFFIPLKKNDYKNHQITIYNTSDATKLLRGTIRYIDDSVSEVDNINTEALLTTTTGDRYIYIGDLLLYGDDANEKTRNLNTLIGESTTLGAIIELKVTNNTCGEEFVSGSLQKVASNSILGQATVGSAQYPNLQLTGKCTSV